MNGLIAIYSKEFDGSMWSVGLMFNGSNTEPLYNWIEKRWEGKSVRVNESGWMELEGLSAHLDTMMIPEEYKAYLKRPVDAMGMGCQVLFDISWGAKFSAIATLAHHYRNITGSNVEMKHDFAMPGVGGFNTVVEWWFDGVLEATFDNFDECIAYVEGLITS